MATITKSVGATGRDYATITLFEAAIPVDIRAGSGTDESWVGECYNDATFTSPTTFSGTTTDSTHTITLTAAAGQSFQDHADKLTNPLRCDQAKGVLIQSSNQITFPIGITNEYVTVSRLQISGTQALYDGQRTVTLAAHCTLRECIVESTRSTAAIVVEITDRCSVINCVILSKGSSNGSGVLMIGLGGTAKVLSTTILRPTDLTTGGTGIISNLAYSNVRLARNVAVLGAFSADYGTGYWDTTNSKHNASFSTNTPGSTGDQNSLTTSSQLEGVTNSAIDCRAKSTGALVANGIRDQTYTNDLDILGQSRSTTTPTIGAHEYVASGGGGFFARNYYELIGHGCHV